jgi:dTDP-4-amino-4,6-dideoxygalactose transaminase
MSRNKRIADMPLLDEAVGNINLCYPFIGKNAKRYVSDALDSRWVGQGPRVDVFENTFKKRFCPSNQVVSVGAGTDALHLAYVLADVRPDDEVICPLFTCTATNIPFLHMGARIRFADLQKDTLNIDPNHVRDLINEKTKAIVCVHYGGLPCDMDDLQRIADEFGIPIIEDAAHALGATYRGKNVGEISDYTMWSFQAIKHITTGDGGMLAIKDKNKLEKAKRIRWFGINRAAKQGGIWENDIVEAGFKYQMNDIAASMGIAALEEFDEVLAHRQKLLYFYQRELERFPDVRLIGLNKGDRTHAAWLCTILVENRHELQKKLVSYGIESNQMHFRNDRYTIFENHLEGCEFPNMDEIENNYLVLPLHHKMSEDDVVRVCEQIKKGW